MPRCCLSCSVTCSDRIMAPCPSCSSGTGGHALMLRGFPEQGSSSLLCMSQGFPGAVRAPWGCCQRCHTINEMGLREGSSQRCACGQEALAVWNSLPWAWVAYPSQRPGRRRRMRRCNASIWGCRCCPAPKGDHCCVAMAVVTNWQPEPASPVSPSPCAMMLREGRAEGASHPSPQLLFTSPSPCRAKERENCLCRLSGEKPVRRQGPRSGEGLWFGRLPWQRRASYEHLSGRSWLVREGHFYSLALWVLTPLASRAFRWKCFLSFLSNYKNLFFPALKGRDFLLC